MYQVFGAHTESRMYSAGVPFGEDSDDFSVYCALCGNRKHLYCENSLGKFIEYLRQSRQFEKEVVVFCHNICGYDTRFLRRPLKEFKWTPTLIIDVSEIFSMTVENLHVS